MRIGQVSKRVGLPISTLRYYERRGILRPGRSPEGYRDYTEQDLAWIAFVQRLLATGMPLAQVQEYARLRHEGDSTVPNVWRCSTSIVVTLKPSCRSCRSRWVS